METLFKGIPTAQFPGFDFQNIQALVLARSQSQLDVSLVTQNELRLETRRLNHITLPVTFCFGFERHQVELAQLRGRLQEQAFTQKGTFLPNLMLSETRMLYPKEYAVGQRALELVRQFCGVQLPEDEAGYIALHLVAGAADGALAYDTVKFVKAVKEIICDTYHCTFEEESLETTRLTVHLKFLAARILRHTPWQDAGLESMYTVLLQRDSRNEMCLQRINAYLRQEFDYELDHQEQVYLLIHLTKIVG